MGMQLFTEGLSRGASPLIEEKRKLKMLEQMGDLEIKKEALRRKQVLMETLSQLGGALKGTPAEGMEGIYAAGLTPESIGLGDKVRSQFQIDLEEKFGTPTREAELKQKQLDLKKGQAEYDVYKSGVDPTTGMSKKELAEIERLKALANQANQPDQGKVKDEADFMIKWLTSERARYLPYDYEQDGKIKHNPGDPAKVKYYDEQIRTIQKGMGYNIPEYQVPQAQKAPPEETPKEKASIMDMLNLSRTINKGTKSLKNKQDRLGLFE